MLLISEGMKTRNRTYECPSCARSYQVHQGKAEEPIFKCPDDNSVCILVKQEDIVEEFARICEGYSTALELISTDSSEGNMLLQAFGGIAAVLRYRFSG